MICMRGSGGLTVTAPIAEVRSHDSALTQLHGSNNSISDRTASIQVHG